MTTVKVADADWNRWRDLRHRDPALLTSEERAFVSKLDRVAKKLDQEAADQQEKALRPLMEKHRQALMNLDRIIQALERMTKGTK